MSLLVRAPATVPRLVRDPRIPYSTSCRLGPDQGRCSMCGMEHRICRRGVRHLLGQTVRTADMEYYLPLKYPLEYPQSSPQPTHWGRTRRLASYP